MSSLLSSLNLNKLSTSIFVVDKTSFEILDSNNFAKSKFLFSNNTSNIFQLFPEIEKHILQDFDADQKLGTNFITTIQNQEHFISLTVTDNYLLLEIFALGKTFYKHSNFSKDSNSKQQIKNILVQYDFLEHQYQHNYNLVRVISHDFYSPLSVLKHNTDKLKSISSDPNILKHLSKIEKSHLRMKDITDQVREFSSIISGKKDIDLGNIDILESIHESIKHYDHFLQQKEIKLIVSNQTQLEQPHVLFNKTIFSNHVLSNLLSNAIKFSFRGSEIHITVSKSQIGIEMEIKDFGVGVPQSISDKLFDPEAKISRLGTEGEEGTGFGLPIMKTYLDYAAASIEVESKTTEDQPDKSCTCFRINFLTC